MFALISLRHNLEALTDNKVYGFDGNRETQ